MEWLGEGLRACLCAFVPCAPMIVVVAGRLRRDPDPHRRMAGKLLGAFALWMAFNVGMMATWGARPLGTVLTYLLGLLALAQPFLIWLAFRLAGADDGREEAVASRRDAARREAEQPPMTL